MTHFARLDSSRLESWFAARGWSPFDFQREVWEAYIAGESGLIHAGTGTGKTYAAWMGPLLEWMETHEPDPRLRRPGRGSPPARPLADAAARPGGRHRSRAAGAARATSASPGPSNGARATPRRRCATGRGKSSRPPSSPRPRACRSSSPGPTPASSSPSCVWWWWTSGTSCWATSAACRRSWPWPACAASGRTCAPGASRPRSATSTRRWQRCSATARKGGMIVRGAGAQGDPRSTR